MTIPFACSCGKSFQAKDEFAGKRTKCPACGQVLVIPQPARADAPPPEPEALIHFRCDCGKEFKVKPEFAGRSTKCPACGQTLVIPGNRASPAPAPVKVPSPPEAAPAAASAGWDEIDTPADKPIDEQPPPKRRPPRRRSPALVIVLGILAVALAGTGGAFGWVWWQNRDTNKPIDRSARSAPTSFPKNPEDEANEAASKIDLGEDLNLVPKDAKAFVAVRVADLVASPLVQQLRKQPLALLMPDPDKEMERLVGLKPADVERITAVAPVPNPTVYWAMAYCRKPYDEAKILQLLGATEERQHKGKTYYYSEARNIAVYFPKDRLLVAGPEEGVRLFILPPESISKGMSIPLKLAATERHHLTGAVRLPPIILNALPIPAEMRPFQPILETSGLTLTLDATDGLQLNAKLDYVDEASAQKAEEAANGLLQLGRDQLAQVKQSLSQGPDGPKLQPAFKLVDALVEKVPITRQGKTVEMQWQADAKTVTSAPAALLPLVQSVRQAADQARTSNNLKQLALAMLTYQDQFGHFPPAVVTSADGRPLYSWRVAILPFLEQEGLYREFKLDAPWDSPHNRKLLAKMPPVFALQGVPTKEPGSTFLQLVVGPGTPFGGKNPPKLPGDFPGGTSNTLLIVTAAEAVPWTKPADLAYDPKGPLPKLGRQLSAGTPVALADGSVRFLEPALDEKMLRDLIAPPGASAK